MVDIIKIYFSTKIAASKLLLLKLDARLSVPAFHFVLSALPFSPAQAWRTRHGIMKTFNDKPCNCAIVTATHKHKILVM